MLSTDLFTNAYFFNLVSTVHKMSNRDSGIDIDDFFLFQQGNEAAFYAFFREYYKPLLLFASRLLKQEQSAEDIVLTSFTKLWNKRTSIEKAEAIKNYLYTSVRNCCLNKLRDEKRERKRREAIPIYTAWEEPVLHHIIRAETINEIVNSMELLPKQCRQVFKKFFVEGKDYPTIAQEMKLSISTVRNQKRRALLLIRGRLLSLLILLSFCSMPF